MVSHQPAKVVIVTGGSGGLGGEIAVQFGLAGDKVVVNYLSNQNDAENIASRIRHAGGEALTCKADVCSFSEVKAMAELAFGTWGSIDIDVNCAGGAAHNLGGRDQAIVDQDESMWDKVVNLNLKGTFLSIKAIAPYMMRQKRGHIINISSGSGLRGNPDHSPYAAAKAGVFGLTKTAARELGPYNIKVNAACPGRIAHERWTRRGQKPGPPDNLLGRVSGDPVEFAKFVVELSSMENVSGQTFNMDSRILF